MSKTGDNEELLVRAYGPKQLGLSDDEVARLLTLCAAPVTGQQGQTRARPRTARTRLWGGAAIAAVLLAGAAGYGVGSAQHEKSSSEDTLPAVLVPVSDGSSRDTRDAQCDAQMDAEDGSITGMTCTWSDGATRNFIADGLR